jgi:hypothetical protein
MRRAPARTARAAWTNCYLQFYARGRVTEAVMRRAVEMLTPWIPQPWTGRLQTVPWTAAANDA